ncbi:MAG: glycosyltransferase [Ferruginibacter sp.]
MQRKKILILVDWFYPGYKAGGPIQSCRNFVSSMEDSYELKVVTSDRDLGDDQPYSGVAINSWNRYSASTEVFYAAALSSKQLQSLIRETAPDYIYINSLFSYRFAIMPLMLKRMGKIDAKIVLAPRGMLKQSALKYKATKKKIFLRLFRLLQIHHGLHFHATDAAELTDIINKMGKSAIATLIPNFPGVQQTFREPLKKSQGALAVIFVGRIHAIKNLAYILACLQPVTAIVNFTIVAAVEDEQYWQRCKHIIEKLPRNISVHMKNDVPHHNMESLLQQHDLFVLPTKGENFGHAIFESLAAGRPVLISDQTPWTNLASHKAGWDIPLNTPEIFTEVMETVAAMTEKEHLLWCKGAWTYCHDFIEQSKIKEQYIKLFS